MRRGAQCLLCALVAILALATGDEAETEVPETSSESSVELAERGEKLISEQILQVLQHFRQEDPKGLPGAPVPDPMEIPDMSKSFPVARMEFKRSKIYGLSQFRIEHIRTNLRDMQMSVGVSIDKLEVHGDYTMRTWLSRSSGPFTVTLHDVEVEGTASLEVQRNGQLAAEEIQMDISFRDIDMDFQNLGFMGSIFQGILNSVGTFVFDSIKPYILKEVNQNIRGDINENVGKIPQRFSNSISPFDAALFEARKKVREMGYDPMVVPDYRWTGGGGTIEVALTGVMLTGLATFHRVGDVTINMERTVTSAKRPVLVRVPLNTTATLDGSATNSTGDGDTPYHEVEKVVVFQRGVDPSDRRWRGEENVTFVVEHNVVMAHANVGTRRLKGTCHWDVGVAGMVSRAGIASFTVESLQVGVNVSQPLDTRLRPTLDDLQMTLGNIQARVNGLGTLDYVLELVVNVLPNLLRYQILAAVDEPLRRRVQEELDKIDVDDEIRRHLSTLDEVASKLQ